MIAARPCPYGGRLKKERYAAISVAGYAPKLSGAKADHYGVIRILVLILTLAAAVTAGERHLAASRATRRTSSVAESAPTLRSGAVRREFQRLHPCPSTGKPTGACAGYVVDHIIPLKRVADWYDAR